MQAWWGEGECGESWQDMVAKGICRMREMIQSGVIHTLAEMTGRSQG